VLFALWNVAHISIIAVVFFSDGFLFYFFIVFVNIC
jgi:hypothetical protein